MRERWGAGYLGLVALGVPGWWLLMAVLPPFRAWFDLGPPSVLDAFRPADVGLCLVAAAASLAAGLRHPSARALAGATTGALGYATILTATLAHRSGSGWVGFVVMLLGTAGAGLVTTRVGTPAPRRADP
ncbi:hypothetical protein ACFFKU_03900 [Kineococcus gynurae]|uniref:Uncharacterized protein n=1 Tax=Kineococcus gynurae TaxID=452979 RepID=A0ABV5LRQ1_9ACTN